jgi:rubrerythrin
MLTKESIIAEAMRNEEDAYAFYRLASDRIDNQTLKALLTKLANEELKHKESLERYHIKPSGTFQGDIGWMDIVDDIKTSNYSSMKQVLSILDFAMDRERKTKEKYLKFGQEAEDKELKGLCTALSTAESGHFSRLKAERIRLVQQA